MKKYDTDSHGRNQRTILFMLLAGLFCTIPNLSAQQVIYVNAGAGGADNGTSWTDAYADLQSALDAAQAGDFIWVASGTYMPSKDKDGNASPSDDRTRTFHLVEGVFLFGGFDGTETSLDQRDWAANLTILDGDIGAAGDSLDNAYYVVKAVENGHIDGFVIQNGNGDGSSPNNVGGGIQIGDPDGGTPPADRLDSMKVNNCLIRENYAQGGGGAYGFYCGDSIIFNGCIFRDNRSQGGAAISFADTRGYLTRCAFIGNSTVSGGAHQMGGAVYIWYTASGTVITNCTFLQNFAGEKGGAIINDHSASLVKNCILWDNEPDQINYYGSGSSTVTYSCIEQDGYEGSGNINQDPYIIDNGGFDLKLHGNVSPCIDSGDPASPLDPDGTVTDMGSTHETFDPDNDVYLLEFTSPERVFKAGQQEVQVVFRNMGSGTLSQVDVGWSVDNVFISTENWTEGGLNTNDVSDPFSLGQHTFNHGMHTIKAWTENPNGMTDEYKENDTIEMVVYADTLLFVKYDATGANDGSSWTDAYTDLQDALNTAVLGDTIWVAAGTYYPTATTDQSISFELPDSVAVYGGFAGTEANLDERNYSVNTTTLSGDIGTPGTITDNTRHVVRGADYARLDGFTITLGYGDDEIDKGGGMLNDTVSHLKVYNCIFTENRAPQGGGVANDYCGDSVVFYGCTFSDNIATKGGGMANFVTSAIITNCTFRDNSLVATWGTDRYGAGMYNWGFYTGPTITNCTFYGNSGVEGGAIHNRSNTATVINCILWGNTASTGRDIANSMASVCNVSYSCVEQDGYAGDDGNIGDDPLLNDPDNGDFRLNGASPCIDAGDPFTPRDGDGSLADMGAHHGIYTHALDAAVLEVVEPETPFQYGNNDVKVTFRNYGATTLTGLDIDWDVDGNAQTAYNWTGSLASGETSDTLTLGAYNFDFNHHTITAWTEAPNGGSDDFGDNDTLEAEVNACNPLEGLYYIGSGGNYANFTAAVNALTNGCGISGPVTFLVKDGEYNEQISIPEIPGVSEYDTIVFRSESGDTAGVRLYYNSGASNIYTIKLDGADHITFMDMTLQAQSASYSRVVEISGDARNNRFTGNNIVGPYTTGETTERALVYSPGDCMDKNNVFQGNQFINACYGIWWQGDASERDSASIVVTGNIFRDQSDAALYLHYIKAPIITGNIIRGRPENPAGHDYGIWMNQLSGFPGQEALISNNFIYIGMEASNNYYTALRLTNISHLDIYHNSVLMVQASSDYYNLDPVVLELGTVDDIGVMNNLFVNRVNNALIETDNADFNSDYNNLYACNFNGEVVFDLEAWQLSSGGDAHSLSIDPRFVADDDLHATHPFLNGAGVPIARVATDIDGEARDPVSPDIGADEFEGCIALSGTYIIDPSGGDFASFGEAVDSMYHCGLGGPVIFDVADGIYTEQVCLSDIPGNSQANSIIFRSASGDSTAVTLAFDADSAGNNYTVKLDGMQSVTFRDMTLAATDPVFSRVVALTGFSTGHTFLNSRFIGVPGSSELVWSDKNADSNNVYIGNLFHGGDYGIFLQGVDYNRTKSPAGTEIRENKFTDQSEAAICLSFHIQPLVRSNLIESDSNMTGIYVYYPFDFFELSRNRIHLKNGGNGIESFSGNFNDTCLILNNHIHSYDTLGGCGIHIASDGPHRILHNTVQLTGGHPSTDVIRIHNSVSPYTILYNNILSNRAFGRVISRTVDVSDYNCMFSNGQYLNYYQETLEDWQDTYGRDLHSVSVPPYIYPDTSYLCFNPLLNNSGISLDEVDDDIEGNLRDPSTPDIGADEFDLSGAPLSGSYTIGAGGDYADFAGSVADLAAYGISAAVTFNVKPGTYEEQVFLPDVSGAGAASTVTFRSETGDSSDVLLTFSPVGTSSRLRSVLMLGGSDYINIRSLSISCGEDFGWPVYLSGGAFMNTFENNRFFYEKTTTATGTDRALIYTNGSPGGDNLIQGNRFENAPTGISMSGISASDSATNTWIRNNVFRGIGYRGIYLKAHDNFEISGNDIILDPGSYNYGIMTETGSGMVFNNFVQLETTNGGKGMVLNDPGHTIIFNTIKITGSASNSYSLYMPATASTSMDNILVNLAGGRAAQYDTTDLVSDYNLLYTSGSLLMSSALNSSDLEEWQAESGGRDLHSISRLPEFVTDTDLHCNDSWIANAGTRVDPVNVDIDGDARDSSHPDIGADESDAPAAMSGSYTIGPIAGDFETFSEAVDALVSRGYKGNIFFDVEDGTYTEQVRIPDLESLAESDSVTFRPASGDSTSVVLQYASSTADSNYVLKFDSADHICLLNMSFVALGTQYARVIEFAGGASYNAVEGNVLIGGGESNAVIYSIGDNDNYNSISGNRILNGKVGVQMIGVSSGDRETGTRINGNIFREQVSCAIFLDGQEAPEVTCNDIIYRELKETDWQGISVKNSYSSGFGIVANNMIRINANTTVYGIGIEGVYNLRVYANSISIQGDADESRAVDHKGGWNNYLTNNILSNTAGGLALVTNSTGTLSSDYNNLYTDGNRFINVNSSTWVDSLEAWQAGYGMDQNSVSVDPVFLSDTNLHSSSPVLNGGGTPLAEVPADFDGETRDPLNPDIGADEFESAVYVLGDDITICSDEQAILDAGAGFDTYSWNTGQVTRSITVDSSDASLGRIKVTVFNGVFQYADSLILTVHPLPEVSLIWEGDSLSITDPSIQSVQWYCLDSTITQATSMVYYPPAAGNFFAWVTDINGCSAYSDTVQFHLSGLVMGREESSPVLYPNPNTGNFILQIPRSADPVIVSIHDLQGRIVYQEEIRPASQSTEIQIDLGDRVRGLYLVKVRSGAGLWTCRMVVN